MVLRLIKLPDPILSQVAVHVGPDEFGPELDSYCDSMLESMRVYGGCGLAAPQVADSRRIIVWQDYQNGAPVFYKMVNPVIVLSGTEAVQFEGCLSVPGRTAKVSRCQTAHVTWQNAQTGETRTETFTGFPAVVVQHEVDHLDGITIMNRKVRL